MAQISLTFPDGNARSFDAGVTPADVAAGISTSLAKKAISATVNGRHWDLAWPIEEALRARGRELCAMRRALSEGNPADIQSIQVIEADQRGNEELLGRIHNQKIFYRPKAQPYVSG